MLACPLDIVGEHGGKGFQQVPATSKSALPGTRHLQPCSPTAVRNLLYQVEAHRLLTSVFMSLESQQLMGSQGSHLPLVLKTHGCHISHSTTKLPLTDLFLVAAFSYHPKSIKMRDSKAEAHVFVNTVNSQRSINTDQFSIRQTRPGW